MTKFGMYAYLDTRTNKFDIPVFCRDEIQAKRKFQLDVLANDRQSVIGTFTKDFDLYYLGEYNVESGEVECIKELVVTGIDLELLLTPKM